MAHFEISSVERITARHGEMTDTPTEQRMRASAFYREAIGALANGFP